jgi:hypothetical protein
VRRVDSVEWRSVNECEGASSSAAHTFCGVERYRLAYILLLLALSRQGMHHGDRDNSSGTGQIYNLLHSLKDLREAVDLE